MLMRLKGHITVLWANSADDKLMIIFLIFLKKSRESKKNISVSSVEIFT